MNHLFFFTFLLLLQPVFAQEVKKNGALALALINDGFVSKYDKNYTGGMQLRYTPQESAWTYLMGHDIYTPKYRVTPVPVENEHPYAAWLYGGFEYAFSLSETNINYLGLSVGTVGPRAQGEQMQEFVHTLLDKREIKGWDSQIYNELGLIFSLKSVWYPQFLSYENDRINYKTSLFVDAKAGNVITYLGGGAGFMAGYNLPDTRLKNPDRLSYYIFGSIMEKQVRKNIFIEGNSQNGLESYGTAKNSDVTVYAFGFHIDYGLYGLHFVVTMPTKEFVAQKVVDRYGTIQLSKRF